MLNSDYNFNLTTLDEVIQNSSEDYSFDTKESLEETKGNSTIKYYSEDFLFVITVKVENEKIRYVAISWEEDPLNGDVTKTDKPEGLSDSADCVRCIRMIQHFIGKMYKHCGEWGLEIYTDIRRKGDALHVIEKDKTGVFFSVCPMCGKVSKIKLTAKQVGKLKDYWNGRINYIQDAVPELPAPVRELFLSGICGECFDSF